MTIERNKWTEDECQFIKDNYEKNGAPFCAKALGRTVPAVVTRASRLGVLFRGALSLEDREYIEKFYPLFGTNFCSEKLKKKKSTVLSYIIRKNLKKVTFDDFQVSDYIVEYFGEWNAHISYILGLMWADGHIAKSKTGKYISFLTIAEKDSLEIEPSLSHFGLFRWTKSFQYNKESILKNGQVIRPVQRLIRNQLSNIVFGQFLFENNYRNKSGGLPTQILSKIPLEYKHYWFRGLFEGDGCLVETNKNVSIQIASNFEQDWSFMEDLCKDLDIKGRIYRGKNENGGCSTFCINRKNDAIEFLDYIFKNREIDQIGFSRKYKKYIDGNFQKADWSSRRDGISFAKIKKARQWIVRFKGKYVECFDTEEEAIKKIEEVEKDYELTGNKVDKKGRRKKYS
jgi:hypothetical protein